MPTIEAMLTRMVTRGTTFFVAFSSGSRWYLPLPFGLGDLGARNKSLFGNSSARIGMTYRSGVLTSAEDDSHEDPVEEEAEPDTHGEEPNGNTNGSTGERRRSKPKPKIDRGNTVSTFYVTSNQLGNGSSILGLGIDYSRTYFSKSRPANVPPTVPLPNSYKGIRVRLNGGVNLAGSVSLSLSATRAVGEFSRLGAEISIDPSEGGVVLGLVFRRLGQKISIPVLVTKFVDAEDMIYRGSSTWATLAVGCAGAWGLWELLVVRRLEERERMRKRRRRAKELRKTLEREKKDAEDAVDMMREGVARKMEREREAGGLVVVGAWYGVFEKKRRGVVSHRRDMESEKPMKGKWIDVTVPIAALVDAGQLIIPGKVSKVRFTAPQSSYRLILIYLFSPLVVPISRLLRPDPRAKEDLEDQVFVQGAVSRGRGARREGRRVSE